MRWLAAPLAAVIVALAFAGCGDGGAEPGASEEATLVLDFTPNAVHAGIYAAQAQGEYAAEGVELEIREPGSSTDAPKLLAAGRADFAILDIHDLAIARERGLDLVGLAAIVRRPLAAVIAADRERTRSPEDLVGGSVGVTGLPSDDAVLASVLEATGADASSVETVTIGFDSIAALSASRVDAATAFWNAEGVALRELGVPTREFRVDDFGAPPYPELVLTTSARTLAERPDLVDAVVAGTAAGHRALVRNPDGALDDLLAIVPELDPGVQRAQLDALLAAEAVGSVALPPRKLLERWARWDAANGVVDEPPPVAEAFAFGTAAP